MSMALTALCLNHVTLFIPNSWHRLQNHVSCHVQHKGRPCSPSSEIVLTGDVGRLLPNFIPVSPPCEPPSYILKLWDFKVGTRKEQWLLCHKKWEWSAVIIVPFLLYDDVFSRPHIYSTCRLIGFHTVSVISGAAAPTGQAACTCRCRPCSRLCFSVLYMFCVVDWPQHG